MSYENYGGNFAGNGQDPNTPTQVQESGAPGQNNTSGAPQMQFPSADGQGGPSMGQPPNQGGSGDQKTTLWYV